MKVEVDDAGQYWLSPNDIAILKNIRLLLTYTLEANDDAVRQLKRRTTRRLGRRFTQPQVSTGTPASFVIESPISA
jgi:hypothetical protein